MMKNVVLVALILTLLQQVAVAQIAAVGPVGEGAAGSLNIAGDVSGQMIGPDRVDLQLENGAAVRLDVRDSGVVRVRLSPTGTFSTRVSPAIDGSTLVPPSASIVDTSSSVLITTSRMSVVVQKRPCRLTVFHADGSLLATDLAGGMAWNSVSGLVGCRLYAPQDEHYFGLGLRGGPIDRRGRVISMWNVDKAGYTEFSDPLYQSYPFYVGLRNGLAYGLFFDNPAAARFRMDPGGSSNVDLFALAGELDYYLLAGPTPFEVLNGYARLTGFNALPPKWTLGYHHSRYGWQTAAEILQVAATLRLLDFPCDSLWFDIDYMDRKHHFTWDPVDFPNPIGLHAVLEASGFERVYINEPCLLATDPLWPTFDEAGYFLTDGFGDSLINRIWFGDVSWIDFSRTPARDWYKDQLKGFLANGISALWTDLNEPAQNFMPEAVYDFDGDPRLDLEGRNLYALIENRMAWEAQQELRPTVRPWNFSRSGYSGIQRWAHTWSGDASSDFASLRTNVQMSVSMGLSGQNQFGHDIGGFLGSPSAELFVRWMEFCLYTPLFRNHSINTSLPREPWMFGPPYTAIIRGLIERRYQLLPYLYTLFEEAARTGRPVLAPTFFYAAGDTATYAQDTEFLLGPSLLVAPVLVRGATTRTVYLPIGSSWVDLYSDDVYAGGQSVTVPAPLGSPPVFVREGAILPRGPVLQHTGEQLPADLDVTLYSGADASFTLYEDDGESFEYQQGEFLRTQLDRTSAGGVTELVIRRVQGDYDPGARTWMLRFTGSASPPSQVLFNGAALVQAADETALLGLGQGWAYEATTERVLVRIQDGPLALSIELLP